MRLLIIEDDKILAESLALFLKSHNYVVDIYHDSLLALKLADFTIYDLIISDYLLPGFNGDELVLEIKKNYPCLPIIMLSAVSDSLHKTKLLNTGADDYLGKPFEPQELLARIKALTRRKQDKQKSILCLADLILDIEKGEVTRARKNIHLSSKEMLLLQYLMKNVGKICSKLIIMKVIWDEEALPLSNTLETHIKILRKKIDFKKPKLLHTKANQGYKMDLRL